LREIQETKPLDLVIEIVDARAILSSRNKELVSSLNKPRLTIALKADLADLFDYVPPDDVMILSLKDPDIKQKILYQLNGFFANKITSLKAKGLLVPQFYIMVVGLPNVGKSSFINAVTSFNTTARVENKAGLTRKIQMIKISENFFIYDTPGIMEKKVESDEQGYKLALINTIKKEVIPIDEVCEWAFNFYMKKYPRNLLKFFPNPTYIQYDDFIQSVCRRYGLVKDGNTLDRARGKEFFFNCIVNGEIGKVNYDN